MDSNPLPIDPFKEPPVGSFSLPGSKSITNRALILAALSENAVTLKNILIAEDTQIMMDALQALGFEVSLNESSQVATVQGLGGNIPNPEAALYFGTSGTSARFLTALLALKENGHYHLDGSEIMRTRPMKALLDALESHGAIETTYHEQPGYLPFSIRTQGLPGGTIHLKDAPTSQYHSALLMSAPHAYTELSIASDYSPSSKPYIRLTSQMVEDFNNLTPPYTYSIEPDFSAASYFGTLALIAKGQITLNEITQSATIQGDIAFLNLLESELGLKIHKNNHSWTLDGSDFSSSGPLDLDFSRFSDTFPTLAAISPLLRYSTRITGIAHTRTQESNRPSAVAAELQKLGQYVEEDEDSLYIEPRPIKAGTIDPHQDHRLAMAFAVLGSYDLNKNGQAWLHVKNPSCCAKTFPKFFEVLNSLHHAQ